MRKILSILVPVAIAAAGLASQLVAKLSIWFWVLSIAALVLVAVQAALGLSAIRSARKAREEFKVVVFDQLAPLARSLSLLSRATAAQRPQLLTGVLYPGLVCAAGLATTDRVRATLFECGKTPQGDDVFKPWGRSIGRGDPPQSLFVRGTSEGNAVWEYAERDKPRFCRDVKKKPPPGWDATKRRNYRTFITVPIRSGDELVGLLTVNAPKPGDLTTDDVGTLQAIAGLLGCALGMAGLRWPVSGG
jgi:GAF domain-containing protein